MSELRLIESEPEHVRPCYLFDFDGTLCDNGAVKFDPFYTKASSLLPIEQTLYEYQRARDQGYAVVIVTLRSERWRKRTEKWLDTHGIRVDRLYMRARRDRRNSVKVKNELYDRMVQDGFVPVRAVEDDPRMVALWTSHGIETVHVGAV